MTKKKDSSKEPRDVDANKWMDHSKSQTYIDGHNDERIEHICNYCKKRVMTRKPNASVKAGTLYDHIQQFHNEKFNKTKRRGYFDQMANSGQALKKYQ